MFRKARVEISPKKGTTGIPRKASPRKAMTPQITKTINSTKPRSINEARPIPPPIAPKPANLLGGSKKQPTPTKSVRVSPFNYRPAPTQQAEDATKDKPFITTV